jgi:hypothetical protein
MILIENPDKFAAYKEVDGYSLDEATSDGWVLVALLTADVVDSKTNNTPFTDNNGYEQSRYTEESFVLKQPRYLVGKSRDKVLEELREERKGLKDTSDHHESRAKSLSSRVEDLEKSVASKDKLAEEFDNARKKGNERQRERDTQRDKMEEDLAKIRASIGSVKFKEILKETDVD